MPESKSGALPLGDSPAKPCRRASEWRVAPNHSPVHAFVVALAPRARERMTREQSRLDVLRPSRAARAGQRDGSAAHGENRRTRTDPPRPRNDSRSSDRRRAVLRSGDRLGIVAAVTLGKDVHFRRHGALCQLQDRASLRERHEGQRTRDHGSRLRDQRLNGEALAAPPLYRTSSQRSITRRSSVST